MPQTSKRDLGRWRPLPASFSHTTAVRLARRLLGQHLVHLHPDGVRVGRIVETEPYCAPQDLAYAGAWAANPYRFTIRVKD